MTTTIIIADDHKIMRQGLRSLLKKRSDLEVIGEAEDGQSVICLAEKLRPDVIIMDVEMPDIDGIDATKKILESCPDIKVLALSMHSERRYVSAMLAAGASGYLLKDSAIEEVVQAINSIKENKFYLSAGLVDVVVEDYVLKINPRQDQLLSRLTPREDELFILLAEGKTSKEIAGKLNLSVKTVDTHRHQIMKKLEVTNVVELTKLAIKRGLIEL